jgi:hypothetical protein
MKKKPAVVTPTCESTATMIGPTTRDPLMTTLFSDNAPGKSTGRTSEGNMADHAGAFGSTRRKNWPVTPPSSLNLGYGSLITLDNNYLLSRL